MENFKKIFKVSNNYKIKQTGELNESQDEERQYIKMINGFYIRLGLWKSESEKEINWAYCVVIVILLTIDIVNGSYTFYLNCKNFDITIEVLFFIIISLHSLFVFCNFIYKQQTATKMLNTLKTRFHQFEELIFKESTDVWKLEERKSIAQTNVCFYLTLFTYIIYFYQTNIFYLDPKIRKPLYPLWTPFSLETSMYYVVLILQMSLFYIHINVHIMSAGLCAGGVNLYGAMMDMISRVFQNIRKPHSFNAANIVEDNQKSSNEEIQIFLLRECIKQHILLKRCVNILLINFAQTFSHSRNQIKRNI